MNLHQFLLCQSVGAKVISDNSILSQKAAICGSGEKEGNNRTARIILHNVLLNSLGKDLYPRKKAEGIGSQQSP